MHEVVLKERGTVDLRGHFHHSELAQGSFMLKDDLDRPTLSITCVGELIADSSADAQSYLKRHPFGRYKYVSAPGR